MEIVETFTLVAETTSTYGEFFYVEVADIAVAGIARKGNGKWVGVNDESETEYDSPLLAAFADANLSEPAHWSN